MSLPHLAGCSRLRQLQYLKLATLCSASTVGAFSWFAAFLRMEPVSQCENNGQPTPAPLFGSFKTLRGNRSCTKWKNVYYFMLFLEGICLLFVYMLWFRSEYWDLPPLPPHHPTPAWNRHSYGNGFRCNPLNTFPLWQKTHKHAKYKQCICFFVLFFLNVTAIQWKWWSLLHYSQLVQGFRFFCNLVNIMYITEKCEYVFVQNRQKK